MPLSIRRHIVSSARLVLTVLRTGPSERRLDTDLCGLLIVDFAPHQLETLREEQHHRRLGFSDEEMGEIIERAGLKLAQQVELHPMDKDNQLTMKIWTAEAQVSD